MGARRAILYARVSGDDRVNEGRNLRGQLDLCRSHAHSKGWNVIAEFAEDDRRASGARLDLPKLNVMLELARRGEFDVLVVREMDRLARSLPKQLYVEEVLARAGIDIDYVLGAFPDTPEGNFLKNVRAAVAELERLKAQERSERGKLQAVRSGSTLVFNRPPYGYDVVQNKGKFALRIREDEADIVRLVFGWYTHGDELGNTMSLKQIARTLTAMGYPTYVGGRGQSYVHAKFPNRWHDTSVRRLLAATVYKGEWRYRKIRLIDGKQRPGAPHEQVTVAVPAIVDEATWNKANDRLADNLQERQTYAQISFLFTGHIWCGQCGARAHGLRLKPSNCSYYFCRMRNQAKGDTRACHSPHFRAEALEEAIWAWITLLMTESEANHSTDATQLAGWRAETTQIRAQLVSIEDEIRRQEAQQDRLVDLYLNCHLSKEAWEKHSEGLQAKLRQFTGEQAKLEAAIERKRLSTQQQQEMEAHGRYVWEQIHTEGESFERKRQLFQLLNLHIRLCVDAGDKRYAQAVCVLGETRLALPDPHKYRKKRQSG